MTKPQASRLLTAAVSIAGSIAFAGSCPSGMVKIEGKYCIDRYEAAVDEIQSDGTTVEHSPFHPVEGLRVRAVSVRGRVPQGYINGLQSAQACAEAGKRLCTESEWVTACEGPKKKMYPYGSDTRVDGLCNDLRIPHPVVELFNTDQGVWDNVHMNDPRLNQLPNSLLPAGNKPFCTNSYGAYDMVGNLEEWIAEPSGAFNGGYYVEADKNGTGCSVQTTAHTPDYHDYSTGFRCCAALSDD